MDAVIAPVFDFVVVIYNIHFIAKWFLYTTPSDVYAAVLLKPTTVRKDYNQVNQNDLIYLLSCQLELMLMERFGQGCLKTK